MPDNDPAPTPEAPASTVTVSATKWRLAKSLSALALVLAIGGGGFLLGHDVFTPKPIRSATPRFTTPNFPSGGFGNGESPSLQSPSPQNAKANAALSPNGQFDLATNAKLQDWQRFFGLKVDGICGPQTWQTLLHLPIPE